MKKSLFILTAGTIIFFTSCSSKKEEKSNGISDKAKANIAASHVVSDAFMTGDLSKIDSVVSSDFVDHTDKGDMGRDSLKGYDYFGACENQRPENGNNKRPGR